MISKNQIRRLRLREGDIVVVKDYKTLEQLRQMHVPESTPDCPIIFAPEGILRIDRKYLLKRLGIQE